MNIWAKGLINSVIAGAATAGSSWMALLAAKASGLTVPELNLKALGAILVMGSLTNLFSYLRSSPIFQSQTTVTQVTTTKENN
jgi:predicted phage tail protein